MIRKQVNTTLKYIQTVNYNMSYDKKFSPIPDFVIVVTILFLAIIMLIFSLFFATHKIHAADVMVSEINHERIIRGIKPLQENSILDRSSMNKCQDMLSKGYFSHYSPTGKAYYFFIWGAGYPNFGVGENLVWGYSSDIERMNALINSPTHRFNILYRGYHYVGVSRCGKFIVQHFGV